MAVLVSNQRAADVLLRLREQIIEESDGEYRFSIDHEDVTPQEMRQALELAALVLQHTEIRPTGR